MSIDGTDDWDRGKKFTAYLLDRVIECSLTSFGDSISLLTLFFTFFGDIISIHPGLFAEVPYPQLFKHAHWRLERSGMSMSLSI